MAIDEQSGAERSPESATGTGDGLTSYPRPQRPAAGGRRPPSAGDFHADSMLHQRSTPPRSGWRRVLYRASGRKINPGPGVAELRERELIGRVRTRVDGCRRIAVVSRKGGVGKTTTTLNLGHTFALHRGDRVVAVDGNPDAGSLGYRVPRETANTITNLLVARKNVSRYGDIRAYTSQAPTRLEVIAADDDPRITHALGEEDYRRVVELLEVHYNLICMDTGTGVLESASKGILHLADQLVVVAGPNLDSARAASSTLDWLDKNDYEGLVARSVAVINATRPKGMVDLDEVERHFQSRCAAVVRIPWDPLLEAGAETSLEELRPATAQAYLELAAHVASGFAEPR